jgi:hypothetical protein
MPPAPTRNYKVTVEAELAEKRLVKDMKDEILLREEVLIRTGIEAVVPSWPFAVAHVAGCLCKRSKKLEISSLKSSTPMHVCAAALAISSTCWITICCAKLYFCTSGWV